MLGFAAREELLLDVGHETAFAKRPQVVDDRCQREIDAVRADQFSGARSLAGGLKGSKDLPAMLVLQRPQGSTVELDSEMWRKIVTQLSFPSSQVSLER